MGNIFIPKTCRVGFQQRDDTFTKKLAYVIYYDAQGKLRKEKSWTTWCHSPDETLRGKYDMETRKHEEIPLSVDVTPYDFENVPTSGFVLNKGHTRYAWSHFGERRTVIRIYDPRGIEFEISPENLVALLMHTDCDHREIQGELVYAWNGTELMLLPAASEEYKSAMSYTKLQGTRVSAKDLQEGFTYVTKNEEELVYLGRHMWHEIPGWQCRNRDSRVGKKMHIFYDPSWEEPRTEYSWRTKPKFFPVKSVPNTISKCISEACHDDFANLVDEYLATEEAAEIVDWKKIPLTSKDWKKALETEESYWGSHSGVKAFKDSGDGFIGGSIARKKEEGRWSHPHNSDRKWIPYYEGPPRLCFRVYKQVSRDGFSDYCNSGNRDGSIVTDQAKGEFFKLTAVFENGLEKDWSDM